MTKVLIVDDHPLVARYTKAEVAALRPDADIVVAGTLAEAEALIADGTRPDYILFDLMLPDCDGLAGVVRLRQLAPNAVIGVISGETNPEVMRDCFLPGSQRLLDQEHGRRRVHGSAAQALRQRVLLSAASGRSHACAVNTSTDASRG